MIEHPPRRRASVPVHWRASLSLATLLACRTAPTVVASPSERAETPAPVDPTPVALADYRGGSSCDLILSDGALYWALQGSTPSTPPTSVPAMATGAVLDCSKTRGTIMSVASTGDAPPRVVAKTEGWPWSLREDESHLYWVGYCDSQLWTVAKTGGQPAMLATPDISVIDHLELPDRVMIADRFGAQRGIYTLDLGAHEPPHAEIVAARALAPWLLGVIDSRVYWGERAGEAWIASSSEIGDLAGEREHGPFRGMPMDTVAAPGELFVLTTRALVRVSADEAPTELAAVAEYGDRGNLALDETHAYFANGKSGTISSVSRRDHARREAHVGGEPCGVAVDERHLYWLDRGRERVMRAPLSIFDVEPPPATASEVPAEDDAQPETPELTGPPPGLEFDLSATPVRVTGGWGLDLRLEVRVTKDPAFDLAGVPAPHLYGEIQHRDGQTSGFGDGCRSSLDEGSVLRRGHSRVFERHHGQDELDVTERGETLTLDVGLCQVGLPDGRWERVPAAEVVLEVSDADEARVTITKRDTAAP